MTECPLCGGTCPERGPGPGVRLSEFVRLFRREGAALRRLLLLAWALGSVSVGFGWWLQVPPTPVATVLLAVSESATERTMAQLTSHAWRQASGGLMIRAVAQRPWIRVSIAAPTPADAMAAAQALVLALKQLRATERNALLVQWATEMPRDDRLRDRAEALWVDVLDPPYIEPPPPATWPWKGLLGVLIAGGIVSVGSVLIREWWRLETQAHSPPDPPG